MQQPRVVIDQMGRKVKFNFPPTRIVSLVPSQTELLYDLGFNEQVVGITKFCEHPSSWRELKVKVGGTKKLKLEVIDSLDPDLIIGNKEENNKESIEALQQKYPVWMSDIVTLDDAFWMINEIGEITGKGAKGKAISNQITASFSNLKKRKAKVLYLIWRRPWMGAGSNTFINSMLEQMGLTNVLSNIPRYPELSVEQIESLEPDHVFLSSEPYPFQKKHIRELKGILPDTCFTLVDGQYFSWYGSRLVGAPVYFNSLII
ncbi:MAG: helical backbone metal receptor [Cyclobacteriaceae bacterium]